MRLHEEDSWHIQYGHLVYNCNLEMSLASSNELIKVCNFITAKKVFPMPRTENSLDGFLH
jgi:hypothetical protein